MIVFEQEDILKAAFALGAGIVLGLEREMKDKAAGVKTITIICLGACLFAILSARIGGPGNATAIAAYIVSGVGFIGAGTIFKEGATISGLTTAGIIWLSAAVGTSIGFGEYAAALIFIAASLVMIVSVWLFEKNFARIRQKKKFRFVITVSGAGNLQEIIAGLQEMQLQVDIKNIQKKEGMLTVTCETITDIAKTAELTQWAINNTKISELQI